MEGPSLVIAKEEAEAFIGKRLRAVRGTAKSISVESLKGKTLCDIRTWGKHFLLDFGSTVVKVHFLMFGSYRINEAKLGIEPRLGLKFHNGQINFYSCSIQEVERPLEKAYDWRVDVMSPEWDEEHVLALLKERRLEEAGDVLLDQDVFAGVGNIIRNEVLFNLKLSPLVKVGDLSQSQQRALVSEVRTYCFQFYEWKKRFELKTHWRVYRKRVCPDCAQTITMEKVGLRDRVTFYCKSCQEGGTRKSRN